MRSSIVIFILSISTFFTLSAQTENPKPILKIGLIADIQYGDCETNGSRFYKNSINKFRDAVKDINGNNVYFTINLGDLTDRNPNDLDTIISELKLLDGNVHNITG